MTARKCVIGFKWGAKGPDFTHNRRGDFGREDETGGALWKPLWHEALGDVQWCRGERALSSFRWGGAGVGWGLRGAQPFTCHSVRRRQTQAVHTETQTPFLLHRSHRHGHPGLPLWTPDSGGDKRLSDAEVRVLQRQLHRLEELGPAQLVSEWLFSQSAPGSVQTLGKGQLLDAQSSERVHLRWWSVPAQEKADWQKVPQGAGARRGAAGCALHQDWSMCQVYQLIRYRQHPQHAVQEGLTRGAPGSPPRLHLAALHWTHDAPFKRTCVIPIHNATVRYGLPCCCIRRWAALAHSQAVSHMNSDSFFLFFFLELMTKDHQCALTMDVILVARRYTF